MELFYYTTTDTMQYILEKGDIFATNIRYMNDSEEYTNGLYELYQMANNEDLVKMWIKNRGRTDISFEEIKLTFTEENLKKCMQIMDYYSISFCQKNDLLSQWAIYAKESGVSIKMNFEDINYKFSTEGAEKGSKSEWQLAPRKVRYFTHDAMKKEENVYEEQAFSILDQLYATDSIDHAEGKEDTWRYLSTYVKRYDFYQETESRLVFQPNKALYYPKVKYRHDKKVLKPYLDIVCENGWPVWEIMIGPGFNQQVVHNSVQHFLEHVKVKAGIASVLDYIGRVKAYFHPYEKELEKCGAYKELQKYLVDSKKISGMCLEEAQMVFGEQVRHICNSICEEESDASEQKKYIKNHRFTKSGIVLSKSSIPYIF